MLEFQNCSPSILSELLGASRCVRRKVTLSFIFGRKMRLEAFALEESDNAGITRNRNHPLSRFQIWFDNRLSQWREAQGLSPNWKLLNHA